MAVKPIITEEVCTLLTNLINSGRGALTKNELVAVIITNLTVSRASALHYAKQALDIFLNNGKLVTSDDNPGYYCVASPVSDIALLKDSIMLVEHVREEPFNEMKELLRHEVKLVIYKLINTSRTIREMEIYNAIHLLPVFDGMSSSTINEVITEEVSRCDRLEPITDNTYRVKPRKGNWVLEILETNMDAEDLKHIS